jgi:malic enzyme
MSVVAPSASYSLTARVAIQNRPGMLGRVASAIGDAGGDIGAVDLVESQRDHIVINISDTPGVARVCLAIADDRQRAFALTMKQNMVAVFTDGTAVLGLGDIGPEAALPVMEGKAMLFNKRVAPAVAEAVARAAHATGVARRRRRLDLSSVR